MVRIPSVSTCTSSKSATDFDVCMSCQSDPFGTVWPLGHQAMTLRSATTWSPHRSAFANWPTFGTFLRGWALAQQGAREEGIAQMRQGMAAWRATGAEVDRSYFLALLAEEYRRVDQPEEALSMVAEVLALVHRSGDCYWEAELHRLKGELLLQQSAEFQGRRRNASSRPSTLLVTSKPNPGSCAPL